MDACRIGCLNCTGPGYTQCLKCDIGYQLSSDGYCSLIIRSSQCITNCSTCYGLNNNNCLTCKQYALMTSDNMCICPTGYYFNNSTNMCSSCDDSCLECSGSSPNNCTSCKNYFSFNSSSSSCYSVSGYLLDSSFSPTPYYVYKKMIKCDPTCQQCWNSSNICTRCIPFAYLTADSSCQCSDGYYFNNTLNACALCSLECSNCTALGTDKCSACNASATLVQGQCKCIMGFYLESQHRMLIL